MRLLEELKYLCVYVCAVADSDMPVQLKYELVYPQVFDKICDQISLGSLYGFVDQDWESHEEEVREFAAVCEKLLDDLDKVDTLEGAWV